MPEFPIFGRFTAMRACYDTADLDSYPARLMRRAGRARTDSQSRPGQVVRSASNGAPACRWLPRPSASPDRRVADLRTVQSVRSIMAVPREACEPPDEARANPSIGALLIEAIVRTDTSVTLWARRVRGVWPFSWHEEFRFYDMDERLMLSQFSAIDWQASKSQGSWSLVEAHQGHGIAKTAKPCTV